MQIQKQIEEVITKHRKILAEATTFDEMAIRTEKLIREALSQNRKAILEEVRSLPRYPTTEMATYENGYNEGHNNAIIDIIQMLERQKLSILEGEK